MSAILSATLPGYRKHSSHALPTPHSFDLIAVDLSVNDSETEGASWSLLGTVASLSEAQSLRASFAPSLPLGVRIVVMISTPATN